MNNKQKAMIVFALSLGFMFAITSAIPIVNIAPSSSQCTGYHVNEIWNTTHSYINYSFSSNGNVTECSD